MHFPLTSNIRKLLVKVECNLLFKQDIISQHFALVKTEYLPTYLWIPRTTDVMSESKKKTLLQSDLIR